MSNSTDSYIQEDTCTFPMYQRLRKINPYAYYFLDAQKQMQQDPVACWRWLGERLTLQSTTSVTA